MSPLYETLSSFENLLHAFRKAARGKRSRPDVAEFDYFLEGNLLRLRDHLRAHTYRPGAYRRFTVADPKPRVIAAAPFADRVVHHALCNVTEPLFERRFIRDSYASRAGKGIHAALDRCTQFARRFPYVLRCDIVQFFPSVDHAILRRILGRVVRDDETLALCDLILAGGVDLIPCPLSHGERGCFGSLSPRESRCLSSLSPGGGEGRGEGSARPRGLPIGNQTSQFWANCYLDPLDHFVKDELGCRAYVRYVDDLLLFARDKATLHRWKSMVIAFLATRLRLALHEREAAVSPVETGIPFLGFRVYPDHRRLRRRNGVAFARRLDKMAESYAAGTLDADQVGARVRGWVAHVSHGDTWRLRGSVLGARTFRIIEGSNARVAGLRQNV